MNSFKKIRSTLLLAAVGMIVGLSGCGGSKKEVAFDTLETARAQARDNALYNAQLYRATSPRVKEFDIVPHGDSAQEPGCPQGDGWASVAFMKVTGNQVEKYTAKCSTVSPTLGCYLDADFKGKPFSAEDGKCQPTNKVPFPLPKIGK